MVMACLPDQVLLSMAALQCKHLFIF
jgi:hypothetical protein